MRAGLTPTERGLLAVDATCRTAVEHVYAVGDVVLGCGTSTFNTQTLADASIMDLISAGQSTTTED